MSYYFLFIYVLAGLWTTDLSAQITGIQPSEYYSSLRVGDTVVVFDDDTTDYHLIIIATSNSCQMAGMSFDPIRQHLAARGRVRAQLYVVTEDTELPKQLQEAYKWQFKSEIDPLGAYKNLYKAHNPPVGLITDKNGVVLAVGPIGKASYDWVSEMSRIPKATATTLDLERNLKEIDRTRLQGSESLIAAGFQRFVTLLSDTVISVCALPLARLDLFHTNGTHLAGTDVKGEGDYTPMMPMQVSSPVGSKGPLLIELVENGSGVVLLEYDLELRTRKVSYPRFEIDSGSHIGFFFATDASHTVLAVPSLPSDSLGHQRTSTGTTISSLSTGTQIMKFDRDQFYNEANLTNYYWGAQVVSDDEVAVCYNLGDTLRIRNRTTGKLKQLKIDFDTTVWHTEWKQKFRDLRFSTPIEDIMAFSRSVSTHGMLFRDVSTGDYYVDFMNKVDSDGFVTYLAGPIGSPRCRTRRVGKNVMCHAVHNGVLYTTLSNKGALQLIRYEVMTK